MRGPTGKPARAHRAGMPCPRASGTLFCFQKLIAEVRSSLPAGALRVLTVSTDSRRSPSYTSRRCATSSAFAPPLSPLRSQTWLGATASSWGADYDRHLRGMSGSDQPFKTETGRLRAEQLIRELQMIPHPEGGWFAEVRLVLRTASLTADHLLTYRVSLTVTHSRVTIVVLSGVSQRGGGDAG